MRELVRALVSALFVWHPACVASPALVAAAGWEPWVAARVSRVAGLPALMSSSLQLAVSAATVMPLVGGKALLPWGTLTIASLATGVACVLLAARTTCRAHAAARAPSGVGEEVRGEGVVVRMPNSGLRSVSGSLGWAWASGATAPQPQLAAAPRVLSEDAEFSGGQLRASVVAAGVAGVSRLNGAADSSVGTGVARMTDPFSAGDDAPGGSLSQRPHHLLHVGRGEEAGRGAVDRAAPVAIIVRNPRRAAVAAALPAVAVDAVAAVDVMASPPPPPLAHDAAQPPAIDVAACLERMRETARTAEGMRLAGQAAFFQTTPQLLADAMEAVREPRLPDGWRDILAVLEAVDSSDSHSTPPSSGLRSCSSSAGGEPTCLAPLSPPQELGSRC